MTWDITAAGTITVSTGSVSFRLHESGTLTITDSTVTGNMLLEVSMKVTSGGQSASVGYSEALVLNLTYQQDPLCITNGTLEAKRVWSNRGGAPKTSLPDAAAKVTWTGCGVGTIARSVD